MMENEENRFAELLQPLRDLAANFDIDIAESLENYLEELEGISFSLDGKKGLNFAEAALLIQGSTTIYSRKVEHLHKLVLQALELVTSKKDNKKDNNINEKEISNKNSKELQNVIDEERLLFGTDPSYLLLDDILEEGKNIDLEPETIEAKGKRRSSGRYSMSGEISKASMILMHSILAEDHNGSALKISCQVDQNGALTMGGLLPAQTNSSRLFIDTAAIEKINDESDHFFPIDNDNHDDGDDGDYYYDDDMNVEESDKQQQQDSSNSLKQNNIAKRLDLMGSRKNKKQQQQQTILSPLDPYDRISGERAIKKGITFRIPSIASAGQQIKTKKHSKLVFETFLCGKIPLTGMLTTQFKDILKYQKSIHMKNIRKLKDYDHFEGNNMLYKEITNDDRRDDIENEEVVDDNDDNYGGWYDANDDDNDNDYNNVPLGLDEDVEKVVNNILSEEAMLAKRVEIALSDGFSQSETNSYEMLCRRHIQNFMQGAEQFARETQLSKRVSEWTKKLEPLLQQEEMAEVFDIHQYSDKLLVKVAEVLPENSSSSSSDNIISFKEIAQGQSSAEVCRVFLACLQLANVGNLDVIHHSSISSKNKKSNNDDIDFDSIGNLFKLRLKDRTRINSMHKMDQFKENAKLILQEI